MSIEDDFIRLKEGGDHLEREMLRLSTLAERVNLLLDFKDEPHCSIIENTFCVDSIKIKNLKQKLDDLVSIISSNVTLSDQIIISSYDKIVKLCTSIRLGIESRNFPKHRAIEVQSSDAGPGVSCHERISQIRFVESFQINNLDLQARVPYAPNDSRSHIAEKAMRALNEHAGDGTIIPLPVVHLTEIESPDKLLAMSGVELEELKKKQEENVALRCAKEVSHRYQGKPCVGTSIHSNVPQNDNPFCHMFFDKKIMEKCHDAYNSSEAKLSSCAGSAYFMYQPDFFKKHYILYDGGTEYIRNGCLKFGEKCDFHKRFENPLQLYNGWSDLPVKRVHPPVPRYANNNDGFNYHYCKPEEIIQGNFTEMYSLTKEKVPNLAENRQPDDYCPRVQLKKLIEECGTPKLSFEEIHNDDGSTTYLPIDSNNTKSKIMSKLDEFVKEYTCEDLRNSVLSDVNHYLTMVIEKEVRKRVRNEKKTEDLSLKVDDNDWENAVLSGKIDKLYVSQLDMYLSEVVGMSTKDIKAKGFTASKKRILLKNMCSKTVTIGMMTHLQPKKIVISFQQLALLLHLQIIIMV